MRSVSESVMGALAEARALGFLGPGPLDEHVRSAERFAGALDAIGAGGPALDLGSGGGIPGLLLADWYETWDWVLFDAQRRRTSFLAAAVARCGFAARVRVIRGRAEEAGHDARHRETFSVVTARSFGPPAAVAEAAAAFLAVGGVLVVAEPPDAPERWDDTGLATVGLASEAHLDGVKVLRKISLVDERFPRPIKAQKASPLF